MSGPGTHTVNPEPTGPQAQGPDFAPPGGDATQVVPGHPAPDPASVSAQAGGTTVQPVAGYAPPAEPPRKPRSRTVMIAVIRRAGRVGGADRW